MLSETRPAKVGKWTEPALRVLRERYLTRQGGEVVETPEEMCWRVALTIARGEARYGRSEAAVREIAEAFYDIMIEGDFLPNSPTLMNAGKGNGLQYSACYVLPVGDSMEEIFDSVKAAAIIHKSGGGTGFAFSRLRPKDDIVASTGGRASGPVSFLKVFNSATEAVKQGGTRRGANMGILRVDHPDILEFIDCKLDGGITNFNVSVAVTDRFMDALASGGEYELINPHTGAVTGRLLAKEVFDRMVRAAWRTGDPGMVFIDRINASPANPTPEIGVVEATNPCDERPMRNSTVTTIAPTGTISMIAGCSSGVEPIFALAFEHRVKQPDGERVLTFVNETFERLAKEQGFYSDALMHEIAKRGALHGIRGLPERASNVFKTSHEIGFEWHVRHQAAFQHSTDNGVSKTINLPNSASEEDVARAYRFAWELGCLGITVFRDGCKGEQVLNVAVSAKKRKSSGFAPTAGPAVIKPRPRSLKGSTYRTQTPIGTAWITITETDEHEPFEVFVQVGKGGSDTMAVAEALGRLISLILRLPSPLSAQRRLEEVISQLS